MNILFDPNIAYLILVLGTMLLLLAIVTPGTGILEGAAIFLLLISGYSIYNIGFNLWALIILVLSIIPLVYAIRKPKRDWALIITILAVIIGSLYLFPSEGFIPAVNPFLAIFISLVVAGFLWILIRKGIAAHHTRPIQDLKRLIGQEGETKTSVHDEGTVQIASELWSARSTKPIQKGVHVKVINREGFTLVVEAIDQAKKK
jgi:membrane-bound serine protease (ClpP class)